MEAALGFLLAVSLIGIMTSVFAIAAFAREIFAVPLMFFIILLGIVIYVATQL